MYQMGVFRGHGDCVISLSILCPVLALGTRTWSCSVWLPVDCFSDVSILQGILSLILTINHPPPHESKHLCQPQEAEVLREEVLAATLWGDSSRKVTGNDTSLHDFHSHL